MGIAQRVITFSVAVPLVMAGVQNPTGFVAMISLFTVIGTSEVLSLFNSLAGHVDKKFTSKSKDVFTSWKRLELLVYLGAVSLVIAAPRLDILALLLVTTSLVLFGSHMLAYNNYDCHPVASVFRCFTHLGAITYIALPMALAVRLRTTYPDGASLIWILMAVNWNVDNGGLFFGKAIGRHKLIPKVSPNKTVEGSVGGLIFAVGTGLVLQLVLTPAGYFTWPAALPTPQATVVLSVLLTIANNFGDLFESYLKRSADTKDSGGLFPGHGGVLDKIDGLLFGAPVAVIFLHILSEIQ